MSSPDFEALSVAQAAKLLNVGKNSLYDAIARGEVPHRRIGRQIRLSRAVLVRWFEGDPQSADRKGI